jgi:hypothetical protein
MTRRRTAVATTSQTGPEDELILLREAKLVDVLGPGLIARLGTRRLEASGVLACTQGLWVVFDNMPHLVRVDAGLPTPDPDAVLVRHPAEHAGFEDLAHDPVTGRFYAVIEAERRAGDAWMARVWEFDAQLHPLRSRWLDRPLPTGNKGIEGLSHVRRDGVEYLLALSEGNHSASGRIGREGGGGRVHVFAVRDDTSWQQIDTVRLPASLDAADYSGLSVHDDRVAVLSQTSSLLWTGYLNPRSWDIMDDGSAYRLPRDRRGRPVYGTAEGVSWLTTDTVAIVSDRARRNQPARFRAKDQSIHLFRLP